VIGITFNVRLTKGIVEITKVGAVLGGLVLARSGSAASARFVAYTGLSVTELGHGQSARKPFLALIEASLAAINHQYDQHHRKVQHRGMEQAAGACLR
jgi:hypothetical protein